MGSATVHKKVVNSAFTTMLQRLVGPVKNSGGAQSASGTPVCQAAVFIGWQARGQPITFSSLR